MLFDLLHESYDEVLVAVDRNDSDLGEFVLELHVRSELALDGPAT